MAQVDLSQVKWDDAPQVDLAAVKWDEPSSPAPADVRGVKGALMAMPEAALSLASGAIAQPVAGIVGGVASLLPNTKEGAGAEVVKAVSEGLTYQPRSEWGRQTVETAAAPFQWLGEKAEQAGGAVTDVTGSPLAGTAVNTAIQALPLVAGKVVSSFNKARAAKAASQAKLNAPIDAAIQTARDTGIAITPTQAKAGTLAKGAEGISGEPRLAKLMSTKNAPVINELIRKDLGIASDTPLTRATIAGIRKEAGLAYEAVKNTGTVTTDAAYKNALANIRKSYDTAAKDFPHRSENPFKKTLDGLDRQQFDAASAVEEIKLLRLDADKAFRAGDTGLGKAMRAASEALDTMLGRHIQRIGAPPEVAADYLKARTTIAKTYAADKAMTSDGNINAVAYAKQLKKGVPLTGNAKTVAMLGENFPRVLQAPERVGGTSASFWDAAAALASKEALMLGVRPVARGVLASGPYQSLQYSLNRPSYGPGPLSRFQANPLVTMTQTDLASRQQRD